MRVMIVDDEQPSLDELEFILSKHSDVKIVGAYLDPFEALEAEKHFMPDVVFLDLVMPHMSGTEMARIIRERNPAVRLVFVTAYAKQLANNQQVAVDGYILKPVSETKLGEMISHLRIVMEKG